MAARRGVTCITGLANVLSKPGGSLTRSVQRTEAARQVRQGDGKQRRDGEPREGREEEGDAEGEEEEAARETERLGG